MKVLVVFAALVAFACAAPQSQNVHQEEVVLLKEVPSNNIGVGGYNYGYELSNGESRHETAELVNQGLENEHLIMRGSFSWVDPVTSQKYTVNYIADENGFRAEGAHIPTI